ncbi:hypothetical protein BDA96_03G468800 [Sorghum bicolor]|uniref:CCHC-type domain-containing protein n=1 Tax=Sorghum bicolor TaxID=4558 RepID=A0A921UTG0_SORBI|nr:hypothetical protein BDA96_03G468800 [Sorghum bicolor]
MSEREPHPSPPAPLSAPPATSPRSAFAAPDPPPHTTPASSGQVLEALLGADDEELVDWGEEDDGEEEERPRSGPSSPAPLELAPIEVPGGSAAAAGGSVRSAAAAPVDVSICPPHDLKMQGAAPGKLKSVIILPACAPEPPRRPREMAWKRMLPAEGPGKAMSPASWMTATQSGEKLHCSPAGVLGGQEELEEPASPKWHQAKNGRRSRAPKLAPRGAPPAALDAFKKRFAGRCFRCLAPDHRVAHCRDPVRCIICHRLGHLSNSCPSRRPRVVPDKLRARLIFPPESIHSRIIFPPLPHRAGSPSTKAAMKYLPGRAHHRAVRRCINVMSSETMSREANRLQAHAAVISSPPEGYRTCEPEVVHALANQLRLPRHTIRVTKYSDSEFLAEFESPSEKDRALCMGYIEMGGSTFPIRSWLAARAGEAVHWWYHVKIIMEHVPLEAWNEEGVKLILGDSCVFDRFDKRTLARKTAQFLGCWVWMHNPDDLPKSLEYTIFAARAGQAMDTAGVLTARLSVSPPTGMVADKAILIHLARYEDWTPRSPDDASRACSSAPTIVPFDWVAGVPDGRPALIRRTRLDGYCAPSEPRAPREDDDFCEPPHQLSPNCSTEAEHSGRVRARSPPAYHMAGATDRAMLDHGRQISRSPERTARGRDALQHASEDWERRRLRSPVTHSRLVSRDPMIDSFGCSGSGEATWTSTFSVKDDPMIHEYGCSQGTVPLRASPNSDIDIPRPPECRPVSTMWRPAEPREVVVGPEVQMDDPERRPESLMADIPDQVVFGKGSALGTGDVSDVDDHAIQETTDQYTLDEETAEGPDDACAAFCARMFKPASAPILPRPDSPPPPRSKAPTAATRSSKRLAAQQSSVPVAERAQHRLRRELSFIDGKSAAPDAAIKAYVQSHGNDLPEQAIKAITAATRLDDMALSRALAAIAAELGAAEMEVP